MVRHNSLGGAAVRKKAVPSMFVKVRVNWSRDEFTNLAHGGFVLLRLQSYANMSGVPSSTHFHREEVLRTVLDTIPAMIWTVRPDGAVDFVNRFWMDYTGVSLNDQLKNPTCTVFRDDLPRVMESWRAKMATGEFYEEEMRLRRADGSYRWCQIRTVAVRDEQKKVVKWYGSGLDIGDRTYAGTSASAALSRSQDFMEAQIRASLDFEHMIGQSRGLREVLHEASVVAPSEASVIIFGETGTGKEILARAIHDLSARRNLPFIKISCASIPATLLESELFGHEKGAFTGATEQRLGLFEVANKGTVFLDEVGEIPLDLQPKLLRVLQDQTFLRLGSSRTLRADVRVIAATNRNLEAMVGKGEFRADLFYRLKVFPITIPPLRDRRDDIPLLVWHYVRTYAVRMKKNIDTIPDGVMEALLRYPWPGNVRELQHFIEQSVILTSGSVLEPRLRGLNAVIGNRGVDGTTSLNGTMKEIERDLIVRALGESNWVIGGEFGAAAKLGLKRTTLASRMESLGIPGRNNGSRG